MNRKEWFNQYPRGTKEYTMWTQKLHIVDTYKAGGVVANFLNRSNPLTYIFMAVMIVLIPLICLLTDCTIQYALRETFKALKGDSI